MVMEVNENELYKEDVKYVAGLNLPWEDLCKKSLLVTGATGLIGSFFVDVLMYKNLSGLNCRVFALGRKKDYALHRFKYCWDSDLFTFISHDINIPLIIEKTDSVDYILHLASNTHPIAYAMDPIGTIKTNIIGTENIFKFALTHNTKRCVFASSNEIYGENRGDVELFDELYCGYIDSNTLRAGYPESKRCGESLCQAYIKQKGLNIVIPRFTRTYGPTLLLNDSKAISQFLRKSLDGEDIVLKSKGEQFFSYT